MIVITKAQRKALYLKYIQNPDNAKNYREFRKRALPGFSYDCIMLLWCGIWLGIEKNGYTHHS